MSIESTLRQRSEDKCELCGATDNLSVYEVPPVAEAHSDKCILACSTCKDQLEGTTELDVNHWHCLNDSMWSQVPAVQVVAWRMLKRLSVDQGWAHDLLDMMYMDDETRQWAEKALAQEDDIQHLDVNGTVLQKGDDVTIIKDLPIKGSSQVIKQGTVVRGISLSDDPKLISGKANGQSMYIIAEYTRKK